MKNRFKKINSFMNEFSNKIDKADSALIIGGTTSDSWYTDNCGCINNFPCGSNVSNNCQCENRGQRHTEPLSPSKPVRV